MFKSLGRMATGGAKILTERDSRYFTARGDAGHSHFREDIRAIAGGALAAAFIVAALAQVVPHFDGTLAPTVAAILGGVAGKTLLA
jgi:hypothetical protein